MASGWTLLAATAGMYALSLRKRYPTLNVGSVAVWMQIHTYLGLFALVAFAWHVGWPIHGVFESWLAGTFLFISASGIVLIIASRRTPKLLSAVVRDYRLEDIPALKSRLAAEAHELVINSTASQSGATLAEFYQRRLLAFFHTKRSMLYRMLPTGTNAGSCCENSRTSTAI